MITVKVSGLSLPRSLLEAATKEAGDASPLVHALFVGRNRGPLYRIGERPRATKNAQQNHRQVSLFPLLAAEIWIKTGN